MTDFGRDTSCTDKYRSGILVSGRRLVAEACYRRLITARGTLRGGEDEANYGLDLADAIGQATSTKTAAALPGQIQTELLKDERVISVDVTVDATIQGPATSYAVAVNGQTDIGPFSLVLGVSGVTVDLLGIQAE